MNNNKIPEDALISLKEYARIGRPVGSFLEAVLSNDLMDAFGRADNYNRDILFDYAVYIFNKMPMGCHGSRKIYSDWIKSGGLEGIKQQS